MFVYTKCIAGAADIGIYSVGIPSLEAGAQPAGDMTLEALGQKTMYALGRAENSSLKGEERMKFIESIVRRPYN